MRLRAAMVEAEAEAELEPVKELKTGPEAAAVEMRDQVM